MPVGELLYDKQTPILDCSALLCARTRSITPHMIITHSQVGPNSVRYSQDPKTARGPAETARWARRRAIGTCDRRSD